MYFQVAADGCPERTVWTRERLFPGMRSDVQREVALGRAAEGTPGTRVRLFPRVRANVGAQNRLGGGVRAEGTPVSPGAAIAVNGLGNGDRRDAGHPAG